ncbi:hypothetical protein GB931_21705 [Modestobacter sp. I12A-02628]|uniref:DUF5667 domain-containing protein n=1 Tax=Goekera deserti TaxID=2497753 RepID=A0A7K3W8Q1_9ACTN|nr:DUF5667 domain-containing protein [Goekera deserti]MPR00491.1 hypothetical protein [Goekera deserti]NDI49110.1 hypothetical protein [Goekera deserti]NEL52848.1 hypothetical protein [Goekera deserti]
MSDPVEEALRTRLQALGAGLDDAPAPAFRAEARARLVAMAAVRTPSAPVSRLRRLTSPRLPGRWRTRVTAGLTGAALTVTALGTLVALSQDATPGDLLYGLKRGSEQTELALGDDSRGLTLLGFATTRLAELAALAGDGPAALPAGTGPLAAGVDADLVVDTLETMDAQTIEGSRLVTTGVADSGDVAGLDVLDQWTVAQRAGLAALEGRLPAGAEARVTESLGVLDTVAGRSAAVRAALTCPAGTSVDGIDRWGPVPVPCATPAPPGGAAPGPGTPPAAPATPTSDPAPGEVPGGGPPAPGGTAEPSEVPR